MPAASTGRVVKCGAMRRSEHDEQATVVAWCRMQGGEWALIFAIPNGMHLAGNSRARAAKMNKLKAEGLAPGIPDLFLPVARGGWHGCFIEMKAGDNKPTDNQAGWLDKLTTQGYYATACWGADEAIEALTEYMRMTAESE